MSYGLSDENGVSPIMARKDLRTVETLAEIQQMLKEKYTLKQIAEKFNCSSTTIRNICKQNDMIDQKPTLHLQPGMIINGYEVLRREYNLPWRSHDNGYWVRCLQCGEEVLMRKSVIQSQTHDCKHERGGRGNSDIVPGMRFGYLTTTGVFETRYSPNGIGATYVQVQCDCGSAPFFVRKAHLVGRSHSHTISCGCASKSAGEIKLSQLLDDIQEQYNIPELSDFMLFDFAIFAGPTLLGLIEYDGEQHFHAIEKWGGEEKLAIQQERDQRKNDYCKKNNIFLLRIPYTDYDKMSAEYLFSRFPKLKNDLV